MIFFNGLILLTDVFKCVIALVMRGSTRVWITWSITFLAGPTHEASPLDRPLAPLMKHRMMLVREAATGNPLVV